jgi:hypothetical protein
MSHCASGVIFTAWLAVGAPTSANADVITDWNKITVDATKTGGLNSNLGTRVGAIEAIAVYDARHPVIYFNPTRMQDIGPNLATFFMDREEYGVDVRPVHQQRAYERGWIAVRHPGTNLGGCRQQDSGA